MTLIINETFDTEIPAGFATAGSDSGVLTVEYNSAEKAADLTKGNYNGVWILNNYSVATMAGEVEIDMEFVSGTDSFFGVYWASQNANGSSGLVSYLTLSEPASSVGVYESSSSWNFSVAADVETSRDVGHIAPGTRKTYVFRTRPEGSSRIFEILVDGIRVLRYFVSRAGSQLALRPCIFVRSGTFRIHGVKAWDALQQPIPSFEGTVAAPEVSVSGSASSASVALRSHVHELSPVRNHWNSGTGVVAGVVMKAFQPVPAARVRLIDKVTGLVWREAFTGADGRYSFDTLDPSMDYAVISSVDGDVDFVSEVTFHGTGVLSGLYRVKGQPVAGAQVKVFTEDTDEHLGTVDTDAVGQFIVPNLDKTKKFYVVVRDPLGLWEDRVSSRRSPV